MDESQNQVQPEAPKKKRFYKKWWFWVIVVVGLIYIGGSGGTNEPRDQPATPAVQTNSVAETTNTNLPEPAKKEPEPTKEEDKKIPGTLGFTPEEFRDRFNKSAKEMSTDFKITDLKVKPGEVQDVFQYMLTKNLVITGAVNKLDGSVREVMILGSGDGTIDSGIDIIMSMAVLIDSVNPELSAEERGRILRELGIFGDNVDVNKLNGNTVRNGKEYWVSSSKELGIMFGVGDVNDN